MLLPCPRRSKCLLHGALSLPAKFVVGKGGVGPDCNHVTRAARRKFVIEFQAVDPLDCSHELLDCNRTAGADVEDFIILLHLAIKHP